MVVYGFLRISSISTQTHTFDPTRNALRNRVTGSLWQICFWKHFSFEVFCLNETVDVAPHTLLGRSFQILGASKAKVWPTSFADL